VKSIIEQMRQAINRLAEEIKNVETTIYKALDSTHTTVFGSQGLSTPAAGPGRCQCQHVTNDQYMGYK